ncbi:MAG TPA: hypothetical protein VGL72_16475, partial [Bryobacteraceae bacterium]
MKSIRPKVLSCICASILAIPCCASAQTTPDPPAALARNEPAPSTNTDALPAAPVPNIAQDQSTPPKQTPPQNQG